MGQKVKIRKFKNKSGKAKFFVRRTNIHQVSINRETGEVGHRYARYVEIFPIRSDNNERLS